MNKIILAGTMVETPILSHYTRGEAFYKARIVSERKSGALDIINLIIPQIFVEKFVEGGKVEIIGQIKSRTIEGKLEIAVSVDEVDEHKGYDNNYVEAEVTICKQPTHRTTPFGREICDALVASNRRTGHKSDYIPCIAWSRSAKRLSEFNVGQKMKIVGRLQSRDYTKVYEDGTRVEKIAYEISINTIYVDYGEKENEKNN